MFKVEIIKIKINFLFIMSNLFFFQTCDFKVLAIFLLFTFFLEFAPFFHSFLNKNYQVRKI
jgi:hypothetical protein